MLIKYKLFSHLIQLNILVTVPILGYMAAHRSSYLPLCATVFDAGPLGAENVQFGDTDQGASAREPSIIEQSVYAVRLVDIGLWNKDMLMKI